MSRALRFALLALGASLGLASSAHAATYVVTVATDGGAGSLRQAVIGANANPGADAITLAAGSAYNLTVAGADGANPAATGDLDITGDVTIAGASMSSTTITGLGTGSAVDRAFEITGGAKVTISGVKITGGRAPDGGGILVNDGDLTLDAVDLSGNTADSSGGGLSITKGALAIMDSRLAANIAVGYNGGAVAHPYTSFSDVATISITDTDIVDNKADAETGGGVAMMGAGALTLTRTLVHGNTANWGGGLNAALGATKVVDSRVFDNHARPNDDFSQAGGIFQQNGTLEITRTTVSGNTAGVGGGLNQLPGAPTAQIVNSTFSGNVARTYGGAILTQGGANLLNTTLALNTAPAGSALVAGCPAGLCGPNPPDAPITLKNSIVSGDGHNCEPGHITSQGHNLDSGASCGFTQPGDLQSTNATLGPLADNGGGTGAFATYTHALLAGSPAIDAAEAASCPAVDQRRFTRVAAVCDMGALEVGATPAPETTITSKPPVATSTPNATFAFTATPSAGASFECWLDDAAPGNCTSPVVATGLGDGLHTFHVRASADGATDPTAANWSFTVDTQAPTATVAAAASPPFGYAAAEGLVGLVALTPGGTDPAPSSGSNATRCVLDPPSAPANYAAIPAGPGCPATLEAAGVHQAYAASIDAAGNTSAVASTTFTILAAPDTTITKAPDGPINHAPTFEFTANSPSASFECAVDGNSFRDCVSPFTVPLPVDGKYLFRVRAKIGEIRDPVSATANFVIDTVAPTTNVGAEAARDGTQVGPNRFAVAVDLRRSISDPEPSGGGGGELRCVLDPPTPPAAFVDIPISPGCPLRFTDVGTHTFYAATVDGAGNVGPVNSATFTIVTSPDTTITGKPTNPTAAAPTFSFVSTIPGSTFECQVDGGAFTPCGSPSTLYTLGRGGHFFGVRAISPDGIADPSPASTLITLAVEEHRDTCTLEVGTPGAGCFLLADLKGFEADPGVNTLFPILCPAGSKCTLSGRIEIDDIRENGSTAGYLSLHLTDEDERDSVRRVQFTHVECDTRAGSADTRYPKRCPQTDSVSIVGPAYASGGCWREASAGGTSTEHRQSCNVKLTIEPLTPLDVVPGGGTDVSIVLPAPGTLVVGESASGSSKAVAARASRAAKPKKKAAKKPLFTAGAIKVTEAGAVTVPLKLSSAAKKTLKKKGVLTVSIRSTFTPTGGKPTTTIRKITLRKVGKICKPSASVRKPPRCD